jgi:UPF0271 protein
MTNALQSIDLNCDLGEGGEHDAAIMPLVSSVNIASGEHAGNLKSIQETVSRARHHATAIGGHPGHSDPDHFGRRPLPISPEAAAELVVHQIARIAAVAGDDLHHVKLHGALYHQVGRDVDLARAVSRRLKTDWPQLFLYAAADSRLATIAQAEGLTVVLEAFADRRYAESGKLVPRQQPDSIIVDKHDAAAQAHDIVIKNKIRTTSNTHIPIDAHTLCVHGDGPTPVAILHAVHSMLAIEKIALRAPTLH